MAKDEMSLDWETYSEVDLSKVGSYNYARHPSTEVLMAAYKINGGKVLQWIPAEGQDMPAEFAEALVDPEVEKWAWNASFEMVIQKHTLKIPVKLNQWRDTMVWAHYCSFPGQLDKAGKALGLPADKLKIAAGKRLMKRFSMLQTSRRKADYGRRFRIHWYDDLPKWEEYLEYNRGDVESETEIKSRLSDFPMPDTEWMNWHLDQIINQAGLPINPAMVDNAVRVYDKAHEEGTSRMREITGLVKPGAPTQLLPWLRENMYPFEDCQKAHIRQAHTYFDEKPEHWEEEDWQGYRTNQGLKEVLETRLQLSRSSIKKFHSLKANMGDDNSLRNVLQFMGAARTGRWAGRVFQPQNLPRPEKRFKKYIEIHAKNVEQLDLESLRLVYGNVFDVLTSTVRPAAQAPEGMVFIDADLNAIENRVLGWLANCEKILRVFKMNRDPYIDFGTYLFGLDYDTLWEEYTGGNDGRRTISKPGVLGCGYMLGAGKTYVNNATGETEATGLLGYAWNMGVSHFTLADSEKSVETFRREFSEVKDYWYAIERAAKKSIRTGRTVGCGHVTFDMKGPFLRMKLPSGRYLHYYKPKIEQVLAPWGEMKPTITYEGINEKKQWVRMPTHPGKITENADQAISRDLLAHGMMLAHKRGVDIRLHVHDQIIGLVEEDKAEEQLKILIECMEESPVWAPDLPLGSEGFISTVFKKD